MTSSYSYCSGCGSWVVDREFVIWVSPCSMVVIRGSQIRDMALQCWFRRARWRDMVLGWLCSVVLGCRWLFRFLGWRDMVLGGCFAVVLVFGLAWYGAGCFVVIWFLGSAMERQRWETEERESDKILLFFYNTCYSAILCLELHYSSIAKKFSMLLFSIPQCRWFWDLKFQISLRFDISIPQC